MGLIPSRFMIDPKHQIFSLALIWESNFDTMDDGDSLVEEEDYSPPIKRVKQACDNCRYVWVNEMRYSRHSQPLSQLHKQSF